MEDKILLKIYEAVNEGNKSALVVITEELGSSPRKSGTMMAVFEDGETYGTVGGGKVEFTIINKAIECMKNNENFHFEYQLNEKGLGMVCGGVVKGYIKVFNPQNKLIIVGAGHIGEKLNKIGKLLDFYTVVIDSREEYANKKRFSDADEIIVSDVFEALKDYPLTERDYIVIATNAHAYDKGALKAVVNKAHAYIGMIGSMRKTKTVMKELLDEGVAEEVLRTVFAPMGIDIASGAPEEIAISIISEILLVKNKGTLNHRKNVRKVWD